MSSPQRKLAGSRPAEASGQAASVCPATGVTIPECSCLRCATEQIRRHAPWILERPDQRRDNPGRAA